MSVFFIIIIKQERFGQISGPLFIVETTHTFVNLQTANFGRSVHQMSEDEELMPFQKKDPMSKGCDLLYVDGPIKSRAKRRRQKKSVPPVLEAATKKPCVPKRSLPYDPYVMSRLESRNMSALPGCLTNLWKHLWDEPVIIARVLSFWIKRETKSLNEILDVILNEDVCLSVNRHDLGMFASLSNIPLNILDSKAVNLVIACLPHEFRPSLVWHDTMTKKDDYISTFSKCKWNALLSEKLPRPRFLVVYMVVLGTLARAFQPRLAIEAQKKRSINTELASCCLRLVSVLSSSKEDELKFNVLACID